MLKQPHPATASPIDHSIRSVLAQGGVIDITTTGSRTGAPRRIEIVFHVIDGRIYISGMPNPDRKRGWLANLEANPAFTFHLKRGVTADLPATARVITDEPERRAILAHVARAWKRTDLETMVAHSPLIEVTIEGLSGAS
jgi:deazaflavin-dependent oxidoreductase (nitroreductase family)